MENFLNLRGHQSGISGSKVTAILLKGEILPIGVVASGRVCACSLRSRLVFLKYPIIDYMSPLPYNNSPPHTEGFLRMAAKVVLEEWSNQLEGFRYWRHPNEIYIGIHDNKVFLMRNLYLYFILQYHTINNKHFLGPHSVQFRAGH